MLRVRVVITGHKEGGGYTGCHSHPGIQSFTEGAEPHAAMNRGTGNARLLVAYIVKKREPRRNPRHPVML
jgi:hypothetical protein